MSMKRHFLGLYLLGSSIGIFAHGLIESPPSRNWICGAETRPNQVNDGSAKTPICSTAFAPHPLAAYNFMSVVTHTLGRSSVTPLPRNVCGFDGEFWKGAETPWDMPMQWRRPSSAFTDASMPHSIPRPLVPALNAFLVEKASILPVPGKKGRTFLEGRLHFDAGRIMGQEQYRPDLVPGHHDLLPELRRRPRGAADESRPIPSAETSGEDAPALRTRVGPACS